MWFRDGKSQLLDLFTFREKAGIYGENQKQKGVNICF